jgi:1-acyl-sn-glycerol-3-phosphate acyltransferase
MIYRFLRFLAWLWLRGLYGLRGHDVDRVPATGGVLIASNHCSFIDPMALGCVVDRPFTFIARGSLKGHWLYRWLTAKLDIVSIERESSDRGQLRAVLDALEAGKACVIFPEGTRSANGRLQPFRAGVVLLARLAKVPVVPAFVDGSFETWPRGAKLPGFSGRVRTYYGQPIQLAEIRDRDVALKTLADAIAALDPQGRDHRLVAPAESENA